jgi:hypothetical protein
VSGEASLWYEVLGVTIAYVLGTGGFAGNFEQRRDGFPQALVGTPPDAHRRESPTCRGLDGFPPVSMTAGLGARLRQRVLTGDRIRERRCL